jgi:hypothetical protein
MTDLDPEALVPWTRDEFEEFIRNPRYDTVRTDNDRPPTVDHGKEFYDTYRDITDEKMSHMFAGKTRYDMRATHMEVRETVPEKTRTRLAEIVNEIVERDVRRSLVFTEFEDHLNTINGRDRRIDLRLLKAEVSAYVDGLFVGAGLRRAEELLDVISELSMYVGWSRPEDKANPSIAERAKRIQDLDAEMGDARFWIKNHQIGGKGDPLHPAICYAVLHWSMLAVRERRGRAWEIACEGLIMRKVEEMIPVVTRGAIP